jgi:hypothetical protein
MVARIMPARSFARSSTRVEITVFFLDHPDSEAQPIDDSD